MYFVIAVGAFSPSTVRGLIHTYTRGFITNSYSRIRYSTYILIHYTVPAIEIDHPSEITCSVMSFIPILDLKKVTRVYIRVDRFSFFCEF